VIKLCAVAHYSHIGQFANEIALRGPYDDVILRRKTSHLLFSVFTIVVHHTSTSAWNNVDGVNNG
jgi:hypothetical protein